MNKAIADYIEDDKDFHSFQLVCKSTYLALNSDQSAWRERFMLRYNRPSALPYNFKANYQSRAQIFWKGMCFACGYNPDEVTCLEVVQQLILGKFSSFGKLHDHRLSDRNQNLMAREIFT